MVVDGSREKITIGMFLEAEEHGPARRWMGGGKQKLGGGPWVGRGVVGGGDEGVWPAMGMKRLWPAWNGSRPRRGCAVGNGDENETTTGGGVTLDFLFVLDSEYYFLAQEIGLQPEGPDNGPQRSLEPVSR
jgi:hypothetical protein